MPDMHIAILTFEGYNELDSLIAFGILNRIKQPGWRVSIACPAARVRSMNGVVIESQRAELQLDPARQLLGAQCSGALILAKLGLLDGVPACTDLTTKPWVEEAGVTVLNQPFYAKGRVATAGGCFASQYLAAWLIATLVDADAARSALHYVAPVGEKDDYVARAMRNIEPYLMQKSAAA